MLVRRPQAKLKLLQVRFWDYCYFFAYSQKFSIDTPESFILLSFTTVKLLKEVKPAPGCKMMKLLTVDKFFQSLDTRIRMTTGFAFSYLVTLVLA